jgi:CheY-like chemotaxis protein
MSHDIRTPLNAIVGMARFAEESLDDREKLLHYIKIIQGSSEHLLQLINDVLDMSRIESGKLRFAEDSFDLKESLDSVYDIIAPLCAAKQQHFVFDRDGIKTERVKGDSLKLNQILINLLNNAVKFTHEDGHISFSARELQSIKPGIASYKFAVRDDGIGIPPDKLEQIFEPFTRMDDTAVRSIEGTGLGLAITKSFVEAMGGKIMVRSEVGKGSEFTVEVSFLADKEREPQKSAGDKLANTTDFSGRRALLTEDNEINRYIASTILQGWGFAVDEAGDGAAAISKFKASEPGYYDIIFMDIQMPVMNGYDAVTSIRRLSRKDAASVPIVAMTANVFAEDVEKARQAGMNAHVGKPIDPDALRKVTASLLSGGKE